MEMPEHKFDWDEGKALANERKHGITFKSATKVFKDRLVKIFHDRDHGDSEDRWIFFGMTENDVLLAVVCAIDEREDAHYVRLISARRATPRERREHESGNYSVREPEMTDEYGAKAVSETNVDKVDDDSDDGMKAEYDFSKLVPAEFDLRHWRLPVHIDNEVLWHFHERARATGVSSDEAINEILRRHVGLPPKSAAPPEAAAERR
jgi:uncharacterized protein